MKKSAPPRLAFGNGACRRLYWITGAVSLLLVALACTPKTHISIDVINEHAAAQRLGQLQPGWNLRHVGRDLESATRIVHRVEVNPERAGDILMLSGKEKNTLVGGIACPSADSPIWSKLTSRQDIVIDLLTDQGSFETLSCRSAIF